MDSSYEELLAETRALREEAQELRQQSRATRDGFSLARAQVRKRLQELRAIAYGDDRRPTTDDRRPMKKI